MNQVLYDFLKRNLPGFEDRFDFCIEDTGREYFSVSCRDSILFIKANSIVNAAHGVYEYLKKYCGVQISWCGNRRIKIEELKLFPGHFERSYPQRFRVYMNYCTLDYSMCWWDFERWEKEIDFMAMNGINMPLAVIGSEAVWYETLLQFGFSKQEALSTVSGPAFWAWQLMTNIEGYVPPKNEKYIYERLELGRKILKRYLEFEMIPIQQGFSGHVPVLLKSKFPHAKILLKKPWCGFSKTAQLDPLDPLFKKIGRAYLENLKRLLGFHHYVACDPFHEGAPPKPWPHYLKAVGRSINSLYSDFDPDSVWVMQAWTLRKHIVKAVPKNRILLLDLNSRSTPGHKNMWGYPVISGMLHNFGGKNAMQGKIRAHCKNPYLQLKNAGANVVGSGLFMEGIEQNPAVYDLQFELLTSGDAIDTEKWLKDYIRRRYGGFNASLYEAWKLFLKTCYKSDGYEENAVGSAVASRPQLMPVMTGPCCYAGVFYDTKLFEKAVALFASVSDAFAKSDGYQYDLCDIVRQALSNRFHDNQIQYKSAYDKKDLLSVRRIAQTQISILKDMDVLLSHRSEMCLDRWLYDSHALASDDAEKRYFDLNARTLITIWGDRSSACPELYDYAWREWSGMVGGYYYTRWKMFYDACESHLQSGKRFDFINGDDGSSRKNTRNFDFGKKLARFEMQWCENFSECDCPQDSDVVPCAKQLIGKWHIGC